MSWSLSRTMKLSDGREVEVQYEYTPGTGPSMMDPGDPAEIEITDIYLLGDSPVVCISDAERERLEAEILADPPDDDYDDE